MTDVQRALLEALKAKWRKGAVAWFEAIPDSNIAHTFNVCADELEQALAAAAREPQDMAQALQEFAVCVLDGYRTGVVGDIDGGWLQDKAIELGLLVEGAEGDPNVYVAPDLLAARETER